MKPMRSRAFVQTVTFLSLALTAGVLSDRAAAGPLSPPSGAVASTGKTLTEVSPETAINPPNSPTAVGAMVRISAPGAYYLTGNLLITASGIAGIEIAAPDVTLDLRGFRIIGSPTSGPGISSIASITGVKILNGTVTGTNGAGISMPSSSDAVVENVRVQSSGNWGMLLGQGARVTGCQAIACTAGGISVGTSSIIKDSIARGNTSGIGFSSSSAGVITDCVSTGNNIGYQLGVGAAADGCVASGNASHGFSSNTISTVTRCVSRSNAGHGFFMGEGTRVISCQANANALDGFRIDRASRIVDCLSFSNAGAGIRVIRTGNTIEGNTVNDNNVGIKIDSSPNYYARNIVVGSITANFDVVAGNRGNVVIGASSPAFTGTIGGAQVSTDPNANITY
ncbi:MAG: right-handed parallel beta-helix repeat-containing protein [Phycisphaerales bacterium]|nr:right-handed parallel beta-helix repeat-containing protein [Phycisphaerales bacterium]